jgi:dihydrofolate synthase/folylpolyglutamate synthase
VAAVQCLSAPALAPLRALLHEPELLRAGLAATRWPGRLERVWPPATPLPPPPLALPPDLEVWLDAAHNPEGAQALDRWLAQNLGTRPLVVLFGVVAGKQLDAMTAPLQRARHVVLTQPPSPRGLPAAELQAQLQRLPALAASCTAVQDWQPALQAAVQNSPPGSLLLVYGSIFLIAAVRGWLAAEEVDSLPIQDPGKPPT